MGNRWTEDVEIDRDPMPFHEGERRASGQVVVTAGQGSRDTREGLAECPVLAAEGR